MLDPRLNDSLTNTMSTVAVAQLLMDNLPQLLKINRTGSELFNLSSSLDLTISLLQSVGVTYEELVDILTGFLNDKASEMGLLNLDRATRLAILAAIDALVSCTNNPIIGDQYLDTRIVNGKKVTGKGFVINLDIIDLFNLFSKCNPTDKRGGFLYGDVTSGCSPSEVWKSGDLDTFMWYLINMVETDDMTADNRKTYWDTRNFVFKGQDGYSDGSDASYSAMTLNDEETEVLFDDEPLDKLFRLKFDDATNNFSILLNPERYKGDGGNKTIYTFNKDYLWNIRLLYPQAIMASIVDVASSGSLGLSMNANLGISLSNSILTTEIEKIISKMIVAEDTEVDDCYFTFSNDEYNELIRQADLKRKGIITSVGDTITGELLSDETLDNLLSDISGFTSSATFQEQKTIIKNSIEQLTGGNIINNFTDSKAIQATLDTNYSNWVDNGFKNKVIQLIRAFVSKIVESVLTPRVVLIYLINYSFINGKMPKTELDFLSLFSKLIITIVNRVMDWLLESLSKIWYPRIRDMILAFVKQILLEQATKYVDIVLGLVGNCTLTLNLPSKTKLIGELDNVQHADILETKDTPGDNNC